MKKILFIMCLISGMMVACSSDDDFSEYWQKGYLSETDKDTASSPNTIVGIWELKTFCPFGNDEITIPSKRRDIYYFLSSGKVRVVRNNDEYTMLKDGEFDYSYDQEKQVIMIDGQRRKCELSDGKMHMSEIISPNICFGASFKFSKIR